MVYEEFKGFFVSGVWYLVDRFFFVISLDVNGVVIIDVVEGLWSLCVIYMFYFV